MDIKLYFSCIFSTLNTVTIKIWTKLTKLFNLPGLLYMASNDNISTLIFADLVFFGDKYSLLGLSEKIVLMKVVQKLEFENFILWQFVQKNYEAYL